MVTALEGRFDRVQDTRVRTAAFEWLSSQSTIHGHVLPRQLLAEGFVLGDDRIRLLGLQGIFKPAAMQVPLSITTAPRGPYDDFFDSNHLLQYQYRGGHEDVDHRDNVGLRFARREGIPLAYFHGIVPGSYLAVWPVFVVADDPDRLSFSIDLGAGESNLPGQASARCATIRGSCRCTGALGFFGDGHQPRLPDSQAKPVSFGNRDVSGPGRLSSSQLFRAFDRSSDGQLPSYGIPAAGVNCLDYDHGVDEHDVDRRPRKRSQASKYVL